MKYLNLCILNYREILLIEHEQKQFRHIKNIFWRTLMPHTGIDTFSECAFWSGSWHTGLLMSYSSIMEVFFILVFLHIWVCGCRRYFTEICMLPFFDFEDWESQGKCHQGGEYESSTQEINQDKKVLLTIRLQLGSFSKQYMSTGGNCTVQGPRIRLIWVFNG